MKVFVVRPFDVKEGIDFERLQAELIDPAMAAAGVEGGTTGLIARSGNIRLDMFERLVLADLVIADISVHNANVFYELGVRHALRDRPTILIRCRRDDVPFDLKTDRYLEYSADDPGASKDALTAAIRETLRARNVDSPVYLLLPELKPPSTEKLRGVPEEFREETIRATRNKDAPRLGLLAEEIDGLDWCVAAWRLIGKTLFDLKAYSAARTWLEAIVRRDRGDVEANLLLATVYQRLGLYADSSAAIERVLEHDDLSSWARAEKRALIGSNRKTEWVAGWRRASPETRASVALRTAPEYAPIEAYEEGFVEDQNHFYSGLNALALRTLLLGLAERDRETWNGQFDTDDEAERALTDRRRECESLRAAVDRSLGAACIREQALLRRTNGTPDVWLALSRADFELLAGKRPTAVAARYREALGKLPDRTGFSTESAARQIRILHELGVLGPQAEAALEALGAPLEAPPDPPRSRVIVFSGHRIDAPGRSSPRFPASRAPAAAEAIRRHVREEKLRLTGGQIHGIAGGANGGDILFHEVCAAEGIPTTLLLALPVDDYAAESVNDGGPEWSRRYRDLVARIPPRILSSSREMPSWLPDRDDYTIWDRNNLWTLHTALAEQNADVTLIVLWDGGGGDGPGGTADMVRLAERRGVTVIRIDPRDLPDA